MLESVGVGARVEAFIMSMFRWLCFLWCIGVSMHTSLGLLERNLHDRSSVHVRNVFRSKGPTGSVSRVFHRVDLSPQTLIRRMLNYAQSTGEKVLLIDVGAHHGQEALIAVEHGMRVVSYDPDPRNIPIYKEKLKGFEHLYRLEKAGVSDQEGSLPFSFHPHHTDWTCLHCLGQNPEDIRQETVPVVTLDGSILPEEVENSHWMLLKIDVQGHELSVLKGGSKLLQSGKVPVVIFEYTPSHLRSSGVSSPQTLLDYIQSFGYDCFDLQWNPREGRGFGTSSLSKLSNGDFTSQLDQNSNWAYTDILCSL